MMLQLSCESFIDDSFVLLFVPKKKRGIYAKWQSTWLGPYKVVRKLNGTNYVVQKSPRSRPVVVHADWLKPYFGSLQNTSWAKEAIGCQSGSDAIVLGGQGDDLIDQSSAAIVNTDSALTFVAEPAEIVNNSSPGPVAAGQSVVRPAPQPIAAADECAKPRRVTKKPARYLHVVSALDHHCCRSSCFAVEDIVDSEGNCVAVVANDSSIDECTSAESLSVDNSADKVKMGGKRKPASRRARGSDRDPDSYGRRDRHPRRRFLPRTGHPHQWMPVRRHMLWPRALSSALSQGLCRTYCIVCRHLWTRRRSLTRLSHLMSSSSTSAPAPLLVAHGESDRPGMPASATSSPALLLGALVDSDQVVKPASSLSASAPAFLPAAYGETDRVVEPASSSSA